MISANAGAIYTNLSTGSGFNQVEWAVDNWWGGAGFTWVEDFDRDGRADVATASGPEIQIKLSRGL